MKLLNKELEQILLETVQALRSDERILTYHTLKKMIEEDGTLAELWENQKAIQKELVHAKAYGLEAQKAQMELELADVEKQLQNHPLMVSYQEAHAQVVEIQNEIEEIVFGE